MIAKIFQDVISEMRDSTTRALGVIDDTGKIISGTNSLLIDTQIEIEPFEPAGTNDCFLAGGYTIKPLRHSEGSHFEYAAFSEGEDDTARSVTILAAAGLSSAKDYYDEKNDRATFVRHIILDNFLPGDVYVKSRELDIDALAPRVVLLIRQTGETDTAILDVLKTLFPDRKRDFVVSLGEGETVLVKEVSEEVETSDIKKLAIAIEETISSELMVKTVIGVGSVCGQIKDLAASYREAQVAIEVGKVFDVTENIVFYENLGLGRLIYQLPATMCEMFLREVFKKRGIDSLDRESLDTILAFFENSLNISETSRKLFVHRNTLVYRLDKIKKITGLDLREFEHAVVFKVSLMVYKYLNGFIYSTGGGSK